MRQNVREVIEGYEPQRMEGDSLVPAAVMVLLYERDGEEHLLFQVRTHHVEHHK
ncbi:MAG: coenzyme A pyrophosphatase, partial [Chloroflexi bacterium]|nr:coenzyme A pyrophosphatase [Chloroflexota bacterium]